MNQFASSTRDVPRTDRIPRHIVIIMDGNGRWAKRSLLPRVAGHRKGVEAVRGIVKACLERKVEYLTLFAFSSENWRRPKEEIGFLMQLFLGALQNEVAKLDEHNVRLRVIGDMSPFDQKIQGLAAQAAEKTCNNTGLHLSIAANYGGRWDICQAVEKLRAEEGDITGSDIEARLEEHLSISFAPEPDLFIRTGGEQRISNFLLWQLAYTELYFTETLWPDFGEDQLDQAIMFYQNRERRFGRTSEQTVSSKTS